MSDLLFVQYPKCGTCKKAEKWLIDRGIEVDSRNIAENNPKKEELEAWFRKSSLPINKFFNTSGRVYKENNYKEKVATASEDELLTILASDGMVVKRPILVSDDFVLVGFNEKEWEDKLKK